jgi:hypothetical protein
MRAVFWPVRSGSLGSDDFFCSCRGTPVESLKFQVLRTTEVFQATYVHRGETLQKERFWPKLCDKITNM